MKWLLVIPVILIGGAVGVFCSLWRLEDEKTVKNNISDLDRIKPLEEWSEKDFIEWKFQRDKRGFSSSISKKTIKKVEKIVRSRNEALERLEQKEDEQQALEARKKLEKTLKECGYR